MIEKSFKKIEELEAVYRKINLMERKRERMGLTDTESIQLKEMITYYNTECNVVIGELIEYIIDSVISLKGVHALKRIKSIVDWNGKRLMKEKEFEKIISQSINLNESELQTINEQLSILHEDVFKGIETVCKSETMFDMLNNLGKNLTNSDEGDILDVINYIDNIYRDFADIFEIDLAEIKLFYY